MILSLILRLICEYIRYIELCLNFADQLNGMLRIFEMFLCSVQSHSCTVSVVVRWRDAELVQCVGERPCLASRIWWCQWSEVYVASDYVCISVCSSVRRRPWPLVRAAHQLLISVLTNCAYKFLGVCNLGNVATISVGTSTSNGVQFVVADFVDVEAEVLNMSWMNLLLR